jgi:hypothetical protein
MKGDGLDWESLIGFSLSLTEKEHLDLTIGLLYNFRGFVF